MPIAAPTVSIPLRICLLFSKGTPCCGSLDTPFHLDSAPLLAPPLEVDPFVGEEGVCGSVGVCVGGGLDGAVLTCVEAPPLYGAGGGCDWW